ncbi:MAG: hypothetical protein ABIR39_03195 [Nocardioides sp.]|uniref:hypothetical protein n=1 Tax=Nocardioides sp. TaxID=35761 RepID=UPI0032657AF2
MSIVKEHNAPSDHTSQTEVLAPPAPGRLRRWTARNPVAAFMIVAFSLAYPVMALPIMASHGVIPDAWMPQAAGVNTNASPQS